MRDKSIHLGTVVQRMEAGQKLETACHGLVDGQLTAADTIKLNFNATLPRPINDLADRLEAMQPLHSPYGLIRCVAINGDTPYSNHRTVAEHPDLTNKHPDTIVPENYGQILDLFTRHLRNTLHWGVVTHICGDNQRGGSQGKVANRLFNGIATGTDVMGDTLQTVLDDFVDQNDRRPTFAEFRYHAERSTGWINLLAGYNVDRVATLYSLLGRAMINDQRVAVLNPSKGGIKPAQPGYTQATESLRIRSSAITTGCPARVGLRPRRAAPGQPLPPSPIRRIYTHLLEAIT